MTTPEVGAVKRQQQAQKQQETQQIRQQDGDIEVFASDQVAAKVDLRADETNSLFNQENYFTASQTVEDTVEIPESEKVVVLPDDIKERFPDEKDQNALKELSVSQLAQVRKLMDYKFSGTNLAQIAQVFKPEEVDKIKDQAAEMQEAAGGKDNVYLMALGSDKYETDTFNLNALSYDMTLRTNILDEELKTRSIESVQEFTTEDGTKYREQKAQDLKNNVLSNIRYDYDPETQSFNATHEIRSKIKEDGTMISREYTKPSQVPGMFDVEVLTEDGVVKPTQTTVKKNGKVVVKKDMVSTDGTRTEYKYKDDPEGNRYSRYKITTADGEVLMNNTKTFKVVDENTFKSSFNDDSYTMTIKDNVLTVVNDKDEKESAKIDLQAIEGNKEGLIKVLKTMSGDQLIALSKTTEGLVGIDKVIESYYKPADKTLHSGDDMFVVLHEEGHAKDFQTLDISDTYSYMLSHSTLISQTPELQETFNKEKEGFYSAFPDAQREHVDYFINTLTHYGGEDGGLQETVAESNAILESPRSHQLLGMRSQYLQQYFPRTIAMLNTLLSEDRSDKKVKYEKPSLAFPEFNVPEVKVPEIEIPKE